MFKIFETHAEKIMKTHLGNMVQMAKADGEFHIKEKRYIRKIGLRNGLNDQQITQVMFSGNVKKTELPESKKLRFFQLVDFVILMTIDGYVSEQEKALFIGLVGQLGFSKVYSGLFLEKIERGLEEGKSKGKLFVECIHLLH